MSRPAPFWLAAPSRFAAMRRPRARLALGLIALALLVCLSALTLASPQPRGPAAPGAPRQTDLMLYEEIVAGVRGGGNYYEVAADAQRTGGYPLRPFFTMRMPGLATMLAALPGWAAPALLFALALATGVAWALRLREALVGIPARIAAALLLLGSLLAFLQPGLAAFHEIWAGLLIALALALRRPGRWIAPVAIGFAAMLIRETAALFVVVMAAFAWVEGERREALGWGAALLLFAGALALHASAVSGVTGPLDPASPGWGGLHGFGLFVKSMALATALQMLPLALAAPIVGLALFGWTAWRDPLAARMFALVATYGLAIAIFARLDTFYWGLMVAPVFLLGLAFAPDGLRDLTRAALDRRRITVTRVTG